MHINRLLVLRVSIKRRSKHAPLALIFHSLRVPFERISSIHASAMSAYVSLTSHAARLSPQTDVFSNKESLRATDLAFHRTDRRAYAVRLLNFN